MRVMVTGGRGFIGRHVVSEARRRGHVVRILDHDLREPRGLTAALLGVDAVIHCAASMSGDLSTQCAVTVEGTRHLLSAMEQAAVGHIVGLSTFALYDYRRIPADASLDEGSPLDDDFEARAPYVYAKRQQEDLIRRQSTANRWRWTILRPGIVFGPERTWFYHLGVQLAATRWVCYAGGSLLPLTYVENCAEAIVLALETEAAHGTTLNIVDNDLPDRRRYLRELAQRTEPHPTITEIPWALLDRTARSASWTNRMLLFGRARLPELLKVASLHARCKPLQYANGRARQVLSWTPRWNLVEALDRSIESAKA